MKFDMFEEWRTPEWFKEAGASMQKRCNYLRLGKYNINQMLEDPTKTWSWQAKKDMHAEANKLGRAITVIELTFERHCESLSGSPEHLEAFKQGFLA